MMSAKEARQFVGRKVWENRQKPLSISILKRLNKEIKQRASSEKKFFDAVSIVVGKKLTKRQGERITKVLLEYGYWVTSEGLDYPKKLSDYKFTIHF